MTKEVKVSIIFGLFTLLVLLGFYSIYLWEEAKERKIESFNSEERLVYDIKETKYDSSIKELVEEYIKENSSDDDFNVSTMETTFGAEDFNLIKEKYNEALYNLYFGKDDRSEYDLNVVVDDVKNGLDDYNNYAIESFSDIEIDLLNSDLEKKLYTSEIKEAIKKFQKHNIAQIEKWELEREERKIYDYMKMSYDEITNYGDNYIPEVHDPVVAELASEKFGISESLAENIYIRMEMRGY